MPSRGRWARTRLTTDLLLRLKPSRAALEGRLTSNGSTKEKAAIRRQLHPQLVEAWRTVSSDTLDPYQTKTLGPPIVEVERGGFTFFPIVTSRLALICHVDILFLRPGSPGSVITHGGDIDNRLRSRFRILTR